jgi:hypothetical protein
MKEFFVMDENFLKRRERAERLLELMQRNNKPYSFGLFSSAETIRDVGVEFLQRLGVYFLWLGVESKREVYEKNRGVDFHALIAELRNAGITVLASGILFLEHHDPVSIHEDIDFMVSLEADFVQFMQLGPLPRTELYESYKRQGLLREDVPYADWHGQDKIWFKHPHFSREQSEQLITDAFVREYSVNGPSILRLFETAVRGATHILATDPWMQQRRQQLIARCNEYRPMLKVIERFAKTDLHRAQARRVQDLYTDLLGAETAKQKAFTVAATAFSAKEWLREKLGALCYQPPTMVNDYKAIPTAKASLLSQAELMLSGAQQRASL